MARSVNRTYPRKRPPIPNAPLSKREKAWKALVAGAFRRADNAVIGTDEDMLDLRDNDDPRITVTVIPTVMPNPKRWNGKR